MKEEILTAKEWLKDNMYEDEENAQHYPTYLLMEKYANYKNRILEDTIKEFRKDLAMKLTWMKVDKTDTDARIDRLSKAYDEHFNIENKQ